MAHPVMWFEVVGKNPKQLQEFYGKLFGWSFQVMPDNGYGLANTGDGRGIPGGVGPTYPNGTSWVTFYTETPDVAASLAKAESLGGKTLVPRTVMPDVTLGIFADPEGHVLGLVEARTPAAQ